jgi:hypothetical protein
MNGDATVMTTAPKQGHHTDPFAVWCMNHPYTLLYVALIVTVILILELIQSF